MKVFCSLFAYRWGSGPHDLAIELAKGELSEVPGFRSLHRLRTLYDVQLHLDERSTLLARARCRAAGSFLRADDCALWVSIDEDVDASPQALQHLIDVSLFRGDGALAFAAMRLRGSTSVNVQLVDDPLTVPNWPAVAPCRRAGAALTCFPRWLFRSVADHHASLVFDDESGKGNPALWLETIEGRQWMPEDVKFCDRVHEAGANMVALFHPGISHAGLSNAEVMK